MRGTTNVSQRSPKKKRSLSFSRIANIALNLSLSVVFLFMLTYLGKNLIMYYDLVKERKVLKENIQIVKELENQILNSKTPEFIEQYARQNLDMLKSGEFVIIVRSD